MNRGSLRIPHSAWIPAFVLIACLAAGALAGLLGRHRLAQAADRELQVAGEFAAHHLAWLMLSRVRMLENTAMIDEQITEPAARATLRARLVAGLSMRYPELVWVGFAEGPGRVAASARGVSSGTDVSSRDWWRSGLRGPYLGEVHGGSPPASLLGRADGEPPRLIDIAVPLRDAGSLPYGVLGAQVDARWVSRICDELADIAGPHEDLGILVLRRDGSTVSTIRFEPEAALPAQVEAGGLRIDGRIDGEPRVASLHAVSGDVVIDRLGWRILVFRDRQAHYGGLREALAVALAAGVGVGLVAAVSAAALMRRAALRPRPGP